ncbi:MAG: hypothetical protein RXN93_08895 [Thermocladium sp.]
MSEINKKINQNGQTIGKEAVMDLLAALERAMQASEDFLALLRRPAGEVFVSPLIHFVTEITPIPVNDYIARDLMGYGNVFVSRVEVGDGTICLHLTRSGKNKGFVHCVGSPVGGLINIRDLYLLSLVADKVMPAIEGEVSKMMELRKRLGDE